MVQYGFYTDQYLGSLIPEKAFDETVARANDALQRFKQVYQITADGAVSENMALCAMAEAVYTASKRNGGITATSVGNVSVRYGQATPLSKQLLQKAAIYLHIRRGVG